MKDADKKKHSTKKILLSAGSIFILVLAAVSFIFIPAIVQNTGTDLPPLGYYKKKPIEYKKGTYFASAYQYYSDMVGSGSNQIESEFRILNSAFTDTVIHMAYAEAVKKSGYIVPDTEIDRTMLPYFYDSNGVYSAKIFHDTPDSTKIELREAITDSLTNMRFIEDLFGSTTAYINGNSLYGLKTPATETAFIQEMASVRRNFEYAVFNTADYPRTEAAAWGMEHPELFTKYDLSVISVADKTTAQNLLKQLQNNELVFADAVAEYSRNYYSSTDGKLTTAYRYQLNNIMETEADLEAVTNLAAGELSGVIETANGFSIFKADGAPVQADFTNDAVIDIVASYMSSYEAGIIETYITDIAKDFANEALNGDFTELCGEYNAVAGTITDAALNYGDNPLLPIMSSSEASLASASWNENFLNIAYKLQPGEISSPIVLGSNIIVLKQTGITTAEEPFTVSEYYIDQADQVSAQNTVMTSNKVQNNVIDVFSKYFLNY